MKLILALLVVGTFLLAGCGNLAAYGDDPFGELGVDVESPDPVSFKVDYINNGAIITGVLNGENVMTASGLLSYDTNNFNVGYKQVSDWLCKYNSENFMIGCASTVPANTGDVFEFTLVAKSGTPSGKYPVNLKISEINTVPAVQELDVTINVK